MINTDQSYQYDYTYNAQGAVNTIAYPTSPVPSGQSGARFKIQYAYSYGVPVAITDVTQGCAKPLWSLTAANDFSSPTGETSGAGAVSVTSGYTSSTNELTTLQAGVGAAANNLQNLSYAWDAVGNLVQRQDLNQSLTETFTVDALDRVTGSTLNNVANLTVGLRRGRQHHEQVGRRHIHLWLARPSARRDGCRYPHVRLRRQRQPGCP